MHTTLTISTPPLRPSTAHFKIPATPPTAAPPAKAAAPEPSSADADALVGRLPDLMAPFEPDANKHVLATVLISECIDAGFDTRVLIRGIAARSTLTPSHVVIVLNSATGTDPERHEWRRDEAGRYTLLA